MKSHLITRRLMLGASGTAAIELLLPSCASASASPLRQFRPEDFGARGDGGADDSHAFRKLAASVNAHGGGEIILRKVTYNVGAQGGASDGYMFSPLPLLEIRDCRYPVIIRGNGACLRGNEGLRYGTFDRQGRPLEHAMPFLEHGYTATPYTRMISIEGCHNLVEIRDLELDGNLEQLSVGGKWGDTGWQIPAIGLFLANNSGSVCLANIHTHHHAQDGLMIATPQTSPMSLIDNVRSAFNGRQGCSFIGGGNATFTRCSFTDTGRAGITSAPAAGFDIESETAPIRKMKFVSCEFARNEGVGMVADSGDSADAHFEDCRFIGDRTWAVWPNKPCFRFSNCKFLGPLVHTYDAEDPAEGTSFESCRFKDLVRYDGEGKLIPPGPIADLGESRNAVFRDCTFSVTNGFALPWSTAAIYERCAMHQEGGPMGYPRGTWRGTSTINGKVDLYNSNVEGDVVVNGELITSL